jgi:hypothetical protein
MDLTFLPEPVNSIDVLDDMEAKLFQYDQNPNFNENFRTVRINMIKYYASKIRNKDSRTSAKNGLVISLMELYFTPEFSKSIGWTDHDGKVKNFRTKKFKFFHVFIL